MRNSVTILGCVVSLSSSCSCPAFLTFGLVPATGWWLILEIVCAINSWSPGSSKVPLGITMVGPGKARRNRPAVLITASLRADNSNDSIDISSFCQCNRMPAFCSRTWMGRSPPMEWLKKNDFLRIVSLTLSWELFKAHNKLAFVNFTARAMDLS